MDSRIVQDRHERVVLSGRDARPPYTLDQALTFYCPQENVESFAMPRIRAFLTLMRDKYEPPKILQADKRRKILLLLPCTKTKPYPLSTEHLHINRLLLEEMKLRSLGSADYPPELARSISPGFAAILLHNGLLGDSRLMIHRMVISEPMGLVPYEFVYRYQGELSFAARYDDPGLFEQRGTSVCPWRPDSTATPTAGRRYRWGANERAAYVEAHNRYGEHLAACLGRLRAHYDRIVAYVAPGITHRSFLTSSAEKKIERQSRYRLTGAGRAELLGAHDHIPGLVEIVPSVREQSRTLENLRRKHTSNRAARSHFVTGGGESTSLILPEILAALRAHLH